MATDAPLLPHQLKRLAKRAAAGMGRTGDGGGQSSGDIFIAFSTANAGLESVGEKKVRVEMHPNETLTPLFAAGAEVVEEAIANVLVSAETMTGADGYRVHALPHEELRAILRKYGRLAPTAE